MNQITVAADRTLNSAGKIRHSVKGLFNGFHGKVGMTAIQLFEEGDLRIRRQIDVLGAVGDKLHEAPTCHSLHGPCENISFLTGTRFWG